MYNTIFFVEVILGKWTIDHIEQMLKKAFLFNNPGEKVGFISGFFLNTEYRESTLIGSIDTKEELVINLSNVDCFTFIDYVEAMRLSKSYNEFIENLIRIRYKDGNISYTDRNHFFTDWIERNSIYVEDVTEKVGCGKAISIKKMLNLKKDGSVFLKGIDIKERNITYIPSYEISKDIKKQFRTGDYAGIYTEIKGLDVSHVGIIIKRMDRLLFRHASSSKNIRIVIDTEFEEYMHKKAGVIVLRPR